MITTNVIKLVAVVVLSALSSIVMADTQDVFTTKSGIFTKAEHDKCDPTCEGTYSISDKKENALLFLKDDEKAVLIVPYTGEDTLTMQKIESLNNLIKGTWKQNKDGTISFTPTTAKD